MPNSTSSEILSARLDALELGLTAEVVRASREARRWKCAAISAIALLGTGLLGLTTASKDVLPLIQTNRLEVVDSQNRVVFLATAAPDGGRLDLWNKSGQNVLRASAAISGGDLAIWNSNGDLAVGAFATRGGGRVEVSTAGRSGAMLASTEDGGAIALTNARGLAVFGANASTLGAALRIGDSENRDALILGSGEDGGSLAINSAKGGVVGRLRAGTDGAEFDLASPDGARRIAARANAAECFMLAGDSLGAAKLSTDGEGASIAVLNSQGQALVELDGSKEGGTLLCRTAAGNPLLLAGASAGESTGGTLQVFNDAKVPVFAVAANADGAGRFAIASGEGHAVIVAEGGKDDGASFLLARNGKRAVTMISAPAGGLISISNATGAPVVAAGVATDAPGGALVLRSAQGKDLARIGTNEKGCGDIVVFNADGTEKKSFSTSR
ncbi:MAG: hypothetical protein EXS10_06735 [Phycisphaerales bacterium]|nr:hypothetical protein [Phycisphaerales bacterium]